MTAQIDLIADLTRSVLPLGLGVAARDPRLMPDHVHASELALVSRAVPKRQAEFHSGRAAARAAMATLGLPPAPVLAGTDRAPIWPEGLLGSISHTATACVATVGLCTDWAGIGVDIEDDASLPDDLVEEICTCPERDWLSSLPHAEQGVMAKLIFSAKEAAYKAQYPMSGALFGFDRLWVKIDRRRARFDAHFVDPPPPFHRMESLAGAYVHAAGILVTGVAVGQSEAKRFAG